MVRLSDETRQHIERQRDVHVSRLSQELETIRCMTAESYLKAVGLTVFAANDYLAARLARACLTEMSFDVATETWRVKMASGGPCRKRAEEIERILNGEDIG